MEIISLLTSFIINTISNFGYPGVFLLMLLESALVPIPSEITMSFAGFLASQGRFNIVALILVGSLGNLLGAYGLYLLSKAKGEEFSREFIKKYGKYLFISGYKLEKSLSLFKKRGIIIIIIARLIPAIRALISIPAGLSNISPLKFLIYTFIGSLLWTTAITYFGYALGENWSLINPFIRKFDIFIVGALFFMAMIYIYHHLKR